MDKKASTQAVPVKQPGIVRFFASVWSYLTGLVKDFVEGDVWVKLSALLWGSSCVARKQYLKGILLTVVGGAVRLSHSGGVLAVHEQAGHPRYGAAAACL